MMRGNYENKNMKLNTIFVISQKKLWTKNTAPSNRNVLPITCTKVELWKRGILEEIRWTIKWNKRGHVGTFRRWIKYFNVIAQKLGFHHWTIVRYH
jgi:hypothetical protein